MLYAGTFYFFKDKWACELHFLLLLLNSIFIAYNGKQKKDKNQMLSLWLPLCKYYKFFFL